MSKSNRKIPSNTVKKCDVNVGKSSTEIIVGTTIFYATAPSMCLLKYKAGSILYFYCH